MSVQRQTWYFTFGFNHLHAGRFVVMRDMTCDEARDRMFETFDRSIGRTHRRSALKPAVR